MKGNVIGLQFALFFADSIDRPDLEFKELNEKMLNLFDAVPMSLPLPKGLPQEIPVLVLRSEKGDYQCNLSRSRIDLIFNMVEEGRTSAENVKDFNIKVAALSKYILDKKSVIRFGMVGKYFFPDSVPVHSLRKKYFTNALGEVAELSLRFNKKSSFHGFEINDVIELSTAQQVMEQSQQSGIIVQRDINNTIAASRNIGFDELSSISKKYAANISEDQVEELVR